MTHPGHLSCEVTVAHHKCQFLVREFALSFKITDLHS